MESWKNVTNTFSEKRRHYRNTYLEICEVYDEAVEVSVFSSESQPYEIYVSYGRMYGVIYSNAEDAYAKLEEIKKVLEDNKISTEKMAMTLGISSKTVKRHIKDIGIVRFIGRGSNGHWEIIGDQKYMQNVCKC